MNLPIAAFPETRTLEVASRWMIQVGNTPPRFIDELRDMGHFLKIDLLYGICNAMIVGMEIRRKENDGDPLHGIVVVVAAIVNPLRIRRIVQSKIQRQRFTEARIGIYHDVVQFRADSIGTDGINRIRL